MKKIIILTLLLTVSYIALAQQKPRPRLMLTEEGVTEFRKQLGRNPLVDKAFANTKEIADQALESAIEVPTPLHTGGGYTHEKHKSNYNQMYQAGIAYQITGEDKYAEFVRRMLLEYAREYPAWPVHPGNVSKTPGVIFYQILNEAVWLTYTANAYDCVYDYIPAKEREDIEKNLFRPVAAFIENGAGNNNRSFNSMHNFGTWMAAGTGMIGYVMDDPELVEKALKGSNKDGTTGFLKQMEMLYSPDGYYDEGPGYQRYALYPFVSFIECINNNQPELDIFGYRNGIASIAVNAMMQFTYNDYIFKMNDANNKNIYCFELLFSTNIAYKANQDNKGILSIIERQKEVTMTDAGAIAAAAIAKGESRQYDYISTLIRVGPQGDKGGVGIIRGNDANNTCVALKETTHGGGHGHFDRLSIIYFGNDTVQMPDYGSVRFININYKSRGAYCAENKTFSQLSIAHNTVTVDSTTHFGGKVQESLKYGGVFNYADFSNPELQTMSASENNAYPGVGMRRTIAMIKDENLDFPCVLDIFRLTSDDKHTYDLAYYYNGHFMKTNYEYVRDAARLEPLGSDHGYQHLWKEAEAKPEDPFMQLTWLEKNKFYTVSTVGSNKCGAYLVKTGANDPNFNMRGHNGVIYRNSEAIGNHTFVSLIEPHGDYNLVKETTKNPESLVAGMEILLDNNDYTIVAITLKNGHKITVGVNNGPSDDSRTHSVSVNGTKYEWTGNSHLFN